jgi:hypothetical protein
MSSQRSTGILIGKGVHHEPLDIGSTISAQTAIETKARKDGIVSHAVIRHFKNVCMYIEGKKKDDDAWKEISW